MSDIIEIVSEAVHKAYCVQYKKTHDGKEYWTGGDYDRLDEATKEYDRVTVRAVLGCVGELARQSREKSTQITS